MKVRLGQVGVVGLAAMWLATMAVAYQVGRRPRAESHSNSKGAVNQRFRAGERATPDGVLNDTQKLGTENRFVSFAQTLNGDELARILPEITDKMSLSQVQSTLQRLFAEVDPGPNRRIARFELIRRWAQLSPEEAIQHIADLKDPKMRHDLRLTGIEGWATVDPGAALEFAQDSDDELVDTSIASVWAGLAITRELDAAFAFVPSLAGDADHPLAFGYAIDALYQNDRQAVTLWIERLAPGETRELAARCMVVRWANHDPEAAGEWIEEHAEPPNRDKMRALIRVVEANQR